MAIIEIESLYSAHGNPVFPKISTQCHTGLGQLLSK